MAWETLNPRMRSPHGSVALPSENSREPSLRSDSRPHWKRWGPTSPATARSISPGADQPFWRQRNTGWSITRVSLHCGHERDSKIQNGRSSDRSKGDEFGCAPSGLGRISHGPASIKGGLSSFRRCRHPCSPSKLDPHGFISRFERLAIACFHGDADKRTGPGRPQPSSKPHRAAIGSDRSLRHEIALLDRRLLGDSGETT